MKEKKQLTVASSKTRTSITGVSIIEDGGWSMRSHGHHYSAMSGVAMIKQQQTKKLEGELKKFCSTVLCKSNASEFRRISWLLEEICKSNKISMTFPQIFKAPMV